MGTRSLLFLALVAACDSLPAPQNGVCGNKVIDGDEDCDTFGAGAGTLCRAPGTAGQCRYACGLQPDGTTTVCPTGMGCGTDGTCRAPDGTFLLAAQPIAGTFANVLVGDVDGDGRADVVGVEKTDVTTTFFDQTLTSPVSVRTPSLADSPVHPLLRDLSGDGRADLVVGDANGLLVNLGSTSRTFIPTAFPSTYIRNLTNGGMIALGALPPMQGKTLFFMGTINSISGIAVFQTSGQGTLFALLPKSPSELAGPVAVGHLVEDPAVSPCDELALAYQGDAVVDVYTACSPDGNGGFAWNSYDGFTTMPATVALPSGATVVRGPLLMDVNGDGHLDFLVGASRCSGCDEVDVAYGVGDGTFHSDPATIPPQNGNQRFSTYPLVAGPLPLAMGDLNGDGVLDQVTPEEVLVSDASGSVVTFSPRAQNHRAAWTEAVIADFNRDGIPDVAAGSSSSPNLSFYVGAGGGLLDPFSIPSAPVAHFTVGDFDGDLVNDLALSEIAAPGDPLGDSVSILFGNPVGAPDPPISMGQFTSIRQTLGGDFADADGVLAGTDTLFTTSAPDDTTTDFGTFAGSGDRVLRSPFLLLIVSSTAVASSGKPLRFATGHFTSNTGPLDVAALDAQYFPAPPPSANHLWLLPTDGEGRFVSATSHPGDPLPDGVDWSRCAIGAVDLDGSGTDQVVALGPSSADATKGAVAIARAAPGPTKDPTTRLVFGSPGPLDALVVHEETADPSEPSGRLLVSDLDGDGRPDVIAVATVAGETSVVVFWNDHGGQLGPMTVIPDPDGHAAADFTVLDAGGGGPSVAILTDEGVSLVTFAQRAPSVASSVAFQVDKGHRIAAGDVDGDGVTDLVVDTDAGIVVYRGHPVRP
jgi:hypothetical protein